MENYKNYTLIQERNFESARKKIVKSKGLIVFSSNNDELNRKILEKENIDFFLINLQGRRDKFKERNSGFNQVLAKIAKKKNIVIGINLDEIINSKGKEKAEILARVKQNIRICNKNKLRMKFLALKKENERDIYDLKSLGLVLGMPTWMTSKLAR